MSGYLLDEPMESALVQAAEVLEKLPFTCMVGGSSGLLLQGVELEVRPRDIDLYVDMRHADQVHSQLKPYATDEPQFSETAMYSSRLSHYKLNGMVLELVGGFCVKSGGSSYEIRIEGGLDAYGTVQSVGTRSLMVMPLAHEFVFNILRNRPDRYIPIAKAMNEAPAFHHGALTWIVEHNHFNEQHIAAMKELVHAVYNSEGVSHAQSRLFT
ncbi:nucleotidyltransferase domain-containing protein [Marinicrinis lubricantis]|uniref:Nucleotidyltransferase domain-containing protein n=1 Tax=Marinicrinis lubricantis TaxID=2086470 RepID=A0ABW1IM29_9BACL